MPEIQTKLNQKHYAETFIRQQQQTNHIPNLKLKIFHTFFKQSANGNVISWILTIHVCICKYVCLNKQPFHTFILQILFH